MNLLEAIKQIAEHSDDKDRQAYMPLLGEGKKAGQFPTGYFGDKYRSGSPAPSTLWEEMYRQTSAAQRGPPESLLRDVRMNPEAVARFLREQTPSENIDDRTRQSITDEPFDPSLLDAPPLQRDPFDPLAQLLGISSIGRGMTMPDIPLPRPRLRR